MYNAGNQPSTPPPVSRRRGDPRVRQRRQVQPAHRHQDYVDGVATREQGVGRVAQADHGVHHGEDQVERDARPQPRQGGHDPQKAEEERGRDMPFLKPFFFFFFNAKESAGEGRRASVIGGAWLYGGRSSLRQQCQRKQHESNKSGQQQSQQHRKSLQIQNKRQTAPTPHCASSDRNTPQQCRTSDARPVGSSVKDRCWNGPGKAPGLAKPSTRVLSYSRQTNKSSRIIRRPPSIDRSNPCSAQWSKSRRASRTNHRCTQHPSDLCDVPVIAAMNDSIPWPAGQSGRC